MMLDQAVVLGKVAYFYGRSRAAVARVSLLSWSALLRRFAAIACRALRVAAMACVCRRCLLQCSYRCSMLLAAQGRWSVALWRVLLLLLSFSWCDSDHS